MDNSLIEMIIEQSKGQPQIIPPHVARYKKAEKLPPNNMLGKQLLQTMEKTGKTFQEISDYLQQFSDQKGGFITIPPSTLSSYTASESTRTMRKYDEDLVCKYLQELATTEFRHTEKYVSKDMVKTRFNEWLSDPLIGDATKLGLIISEDRKMISDYKNGRYRIPSEKFERMVANVDAWKRQNK